MVDTEPSTPSQLMEAASHIMQRRSMVFRLPS